MAKLEGQSIASSYEQLLHVDRDGGGNTTNLVDVKDGKNTTTFALKLATDKAEIDGKLTIDQDSNSPALVIDTEATSEYAIHINTPAITTSDVININADALTTGSILNLSSDSSNTSSRQLVKIVNENTAANATVPLYIRQDAAQSGMTLEQNGTAYGLNLDINGSGNGINVDNAGTGNAIKIDQNGNAVALNIDTQGTGSAIYASSTATSSNSIIELYRAVDADGEYVAQWMGKAASAGDALALSYYYHTGTDAYAELSVYGSNGLVVKEGGNVGIGVVSPAQKLTVSSGSADGGIGLLATGGYNNHIEFGDADDADIGRIIYDHGANRMTFTTNNAERLRIDSSGNVNIGGTTAFGFTPGLSVEGTQPSLILQKDASNFFNTNVADGFVYVMFDHAAQIQFGNATNVGGTGFVRNFILDTNSRISLSNNDGGANNTTFGNLAGAALTTNGDRNSLFGHLAGNDISSGQENTLIGYTAGEKITTGLYNTAVGSQAFVTNVDGDFNTAIGYAALYNFEASSDGEGKNVAVGSNASFHLDTGQQNTMVGASAGESSAGSITYSDNTGIGYKALFAVTTGNTNTAIGSQAGLSITTGAENTIVGDKAGDAIGVGNSNTLVGQAAGGALTDGDNNVAIGASTMAQDDLGQGSTAVGAGAFSSQNMASEALTKNTGIGYQAGFYNVTGTSNSFLGYRAGFGASGQSNSNNVGVGQSALLGITTGAGNIAIGSSAGASITDGDSNTVVGYLALSSSVSAQSNTAIGRSAMQNTTTAHTNVAIGGETMGGITTATVQDATAVGYAAFKGSSSTTTGTNGTTAIGRKALFSLTSGSANTAIGYQSISEIVDGSRNTAVGYGSMQNSVGGTTSDGSNDNTFIGYLSGGGQWANTQSVGNTAVGSETAMSDSWNGPSYSSLFGFRAGQTITTGSRNTLFGYSSGSNITTGSGNTQIGASAQASAADVTDEIVLKAGTDNLAGGGTETIRIGVDSDFITNDFGENATWTHSSDKRIKKNIKPLDLGLQFVNDLKPVTFNKKAPSEYPKEFEQYNPKKTKRINPDAVNYGFIAQEVKESMDKAGHSKFPMWKENKDGMQMLGETALIPTLVKAIQELSAKVTELENKLK
jgi:hypothetical protein|tara:strand:- start:237 stop:3590 length:3354 start_codon:yes stop_codon:yes gene_type:complete